MKTNTFYNPRNQFGELLASQPELADAKNELNDAIKAEADERDKNDDEIRESLATTEDKLNTKIENLNTIKVKWINAERGDNKFSEIDDYFKSRLENATEEEIAELKIELGQTIYIIEGTDDASTYEEWVCRYPNVEINSTQLPEMIRLGAVDSILARVDSAGSVKLVHNLYDEEDWSKYFTTDYEGNVTHKPIKGQAVAPCALKAFVDRDNEIDSELTQEIKDRETSDNSIRTDVNAALEKLTSDYIAADKALGARLTSLEIEVGGSTVGDEVDKHDSRLDLIEAAIGMNHHNCANCGCDHSQCSTHDSCSDATNKCTIYCRLNDAEGDLEELNTNLGELDAKLDDEVTRLEDLINKEKAERELADSTIQDQIDELASSDSGLQEQIDSLKDDLDEEISLRIEKDDAIWSEIGKSANPDTGTIWGEIKQIQKGIGSQDAPYEDTIWERIKNNKDELDGEIADLIETDESLLKADEKQIGRIAILEEKLENVTTEIGTKLPTDINIWNSIHTEIAAREASDDQLSKDIEDALVEAKTYTDGLKVITLSEAAEYAQNKADAAKEAAIVAAANDATIKADAAEDAAITTAANDATIKADAAKEAAITTATENAKQYTDTAKTECNDYTDTKIELLSLTVTTKISDAKQEAIDAAVEEVTDTIASKVDQSDFDTQVSTINTQLSSKADATQLDLKADATQLSEANNKIENLESDLGNLSHEFHHLTAQTQFVVRTKLPGNDSKTIDFYNLIGETSNEWNVVRITAVITEEDGKGYETIYPEIVYSGELTTDGNDNRKVEIRFEHGEGSELPVMLIVSTFKTSEEHIREID